MYGHREKIKQYHQKDIEESTQINFDASWNTKENTWCVYHLEQNNGSIKRYEFIGHPESGNEEYKICEFDTEEEYKDAINNIRYGNDFPNIKQEGNH